MKAKEFAAMSAEDLTAKIADLKEELFNLRFRLATGQLDDVMQILRRSGCDCARCDTSEKNRHAHPRASSPLRQIHHPHFQNPCA